MNNKEPLLDGLGRVHTNLRVSVTDRCNIRCFYCMPNVDVKFKRRDQLLTFEEIQRFVRIVAERGVNKLRITGGEPLVRSELPSLIRQLSDTPGIDDIALTTNGMLLAEQASALREAGLNRVNISLDTLDEETFQRISRRPGVDQTIAGIDAALEVGFDLVRLNAIAIRNLTEGELVPLARFARERGLELRFIEFMPLDAEQHWQSDQVLSGNEIRETIQREVGELTAAPRPDPSQPAVDYQYVDGGGTIGFINPVSEPFCGTCNRLRITADGKVRNCLFSTDDYDVLALMRDGADDREILDLVQRCLAAKKPGHGIDSDDFERPERAMYQIGG
ncbi:MAG TPA: GTP 3',8-cyclase MoaA [Planctomycetes bacterium]|nr:GTP 3',8-cyclase MoaA [Planctomycetaceae bacterium]HIM27941.1 GTP 3',8-cyclase MoaA [Planctomycetota bacterium]